MPKDEEKEKEVKLGWEAYFGNLARAASARSSCDRAHVGTVLVKDRQVVATGYNGSISGTPHCDDVGHLIVDGHCVRSEHSERNSLASAAKRGAETNGAVCYSTHFPCWPCFRMLAQAGISKIVYNDFKLNNMTPEIVDLMLQAPVELMSNVQNHFKDHVKIVDGKVEVRPH